MKKCLMACTLVILILAAADDCLANKKKSLDGIPLVWKPTTELGEKGAVDLTGLDEVKITVALLREPSSGSPPPMTWPNSLPRI